MGNFRKVRRVKPIPPDADLARTFSKARILTYGAVILLPPYGLYRVWRGDATFTRAEKWVWSLIILAYLGYFFQLIA